MQRRDSSLVVLACGMAAAAPGLVHGQTSSRLNERILELALRQVEPARGPTDQIGPDVIVGELMNTQSGTSITLTISPSGTSATEVSYGLGTTSCNKGDAELQWVSSTNQHPVIAQNMYRIKDGRFEQLGQGWVKHGFTALQQNSCGLGCIPSGTGSRLGVGCSDPYSASLNASQSYLGPRYQVDPFSGYFPYPWSHTVPSASGDFARRLRLKIADVEVSPTNTIFIAEGQYVAADDAAAGNGANNASYRRLTFNASRQITFTGPTVREVPAIFAWRDLGNNGSVDPDVMISTVDLAPSDGILFVASKTIDLGDGWWRYEYAVQNLTSDRMGGSFRVPIRPGVQVSDAEWRGVDSHSGWPAEDATRNAPWTIAVESDHVEWGAPVAFNPAKPMEGNGLRWATVYNFRFLANAPPDPDGMASLGFYKPGTPSSIEAKAWIPQSVAAPCYPNCDGSTTPPILNVEDFTCFISEFANAQSLGYVQQVLHYANCDRSTTVPVLNVEDFTCFISAFATGCP